MTEIQLIQLGFERIELNDDVLLGSQGFLGHVYEMVFPNIGRTIASNLIEKGKEITFLLCDLEGGILRNIEAT